MNNSRFEIVLPSDMWQELHSHLIRKSDRVGCEQDEQLAFILVAHNLTVDGIRLVGRELLLAELDDFDYQSTSSLRPNSLFVTRALTRCRQEGWSLVEVHSHPFDSSSSTTFSGIDWVNDEAKMPSLAKMFPGDFHHATMVVGQIALDAHFYDRHSAGILPVTAVRIVGSSADSNEIVQVLTPTSATSQTKTRISGTHERQVPLIGKATQQALAKARVVIVGLGGLGSFVSLELAHIGVGNLVLIDDDVIEESNLNRLLGANGSNVGQSKVSFYRNVIQRIAPSATVTAMQASIFDRKALEQAKSADLILGCVDNHGARLVLNHLSVRYVIPLIDAGTGARIGEDDTLDRIGGQVQVVAPGMGCLECRGFIDPQRAAFDLASPEMQAYERSHGYGTEEPAPSVIFLNGVVASMQVAEVVRIMSPTLRGKSSSRAIVAYDALKQRALPVVSQSSPICVTCGRDGVTGVADLAPIQLHSSEVRRSPGMTPQLPGL
ncbi:ThiF family adenylyltransferase [Allokutzneria sp. A3M-2-11 16]|uniref:HesA/MoeB/ThiF family protein n=1 Tax=Allokutzneria sp. A3M-2-11 16 TaxID=2962043 RepID=UPI0020B8883E|nr:ThiF family adenylyltransferase [Allokutzneria sp. A3M-2-11 16]MCP3797970.1 ThiF family adenylyltransferase [Allokutzneria sp. A3M-2-11 16]